MFKLFLELKTVKFQNSRFVHVALKIWVPLKSDFYHGQVFQSFQNLTTQSQIKMLIEKMGKKNFYVPVRKFTTRWGYGKKFPCPRFFEPQNFFSQFCSCPLTPNARLTSAATSFDRKRHFTPWLWWILTIFLEIMSSPEVFMVLFFSSKPVNHPD